MIPPGRCYLSALAIALLSQACAPDPRERGSQVTRLELEPCRFQAFDEMLADWPEDEDPPPVGPEAGEARCGTLEVWEDRAAASGRRIGIQVIVLPASGEDPAPDPLLPFAGGPGTAVSDWGWLPLMTGIREERDIVLVDQRGTGGSHPLACDPATTVQELFEPMLSDAYVDACRAKLEQVADLRFYRTLDHVEDVDEVRRALGYELINLWGGSYGTRPVLLYARHHSGAVRTAAVEGVLHTDFEYPSHHAAAGQRALDKLFDACATDAECAAAYPDPRADLETLMARFADGPVAVEIDVGDGERQVVALHGEIVAERFRTLMYWAGNGVRIPRMLRDAVESGSLEEWGESLLTYERGFDEGVDWFTGMWLSVTCTEDVHRIDDAEVTERTAGTVMGDYRVRTHRRACERWPQGEVPDGFYEPVRSELPFLLVAGDFDPVTPPWSTREAAAHLPNGRFVLVQEGHASTDTACASSVLEAFVEAGTADGLDTSCLEAVELPPWDFGSG